MQVLEKRTYDNRVFDILCAALLDSGETVVSATVTADQGAMTFGSATVNSGALTYSDGTIAAAGTVVQVRVSGGTIPLTQGELLCTLRARAATSSGGQLEATVQLRLTDNPA